MKKIFLLTLLLLSFSVSVFAGSYTGWKTFTIPNELEFQIPTTLKLKEESLNRLNSNIQSSLPQRKLELRFIPSNSDGSKHHALVRVRVDINEDNPMSFKLGDKINFPKEDLLSWEFSYLSSLTQQFAKSNSNIHLGEITNHAQVINVENNDCIYFEFTTHHEQEPYYYNYFYRFLNGTRGYRVIMRIRSDELNYWLQNGNDVRNIVRTLNVLHK